MIKSYQTPSRCSRKIGYLPDSSMILTLNLIHKLNQMKTMKADDEYNDNLLNVSLLGSIT